MTLTGVVGLSDSLGIFISMVWTLGDAHHPSFFHSLLWRHGTLLYSLTELGDQRLFVIAMKWCLSSPILWAKGT